MAKQGQFILVQPPDSRIYPWVDPELVGIIFTYHLSKKVEDVCIKVGPYYSWVLSHIDKGKQIHNRYDRFVFPFYECFFTQLKLMLPFTISKRAC